MCVEVLLILGDCRVAIQYIMHGGEGERGLGDSGRGEERPGGQWERGREAWETVGERSSMGGLDHYLIMYVVMSENWT